MDNASRPSMGSRTPEMPRSLSRTLFQCRVCKKGYDKADHLKRHVKSRMVAWKALLVLLTSRKSGLTLQHRYR
jgi:hypothetical protein